MKETEECQDEQCTEDCQWSDWTAWSKCSKDCVDDDPDSADYRVVGRQFREREILRPATGGTPCPDPYDANARSEFYQEQDCNANNMCAIHCAFTSFDAWSDCSKSCGDGHSTRSRTITKDSKHGGSVCPITEESRQCNDNQCPRDCDQTEWTAWSSCSKSCNVGWRHRTRETNQEAEYGGVACTPDRDEEMCNTQHCPINCEWDDYTEWSACSTTCGVHGTQRRTRQTKYSAAFGGTECTGLAVDTKSCDVDDPNVGNYIGDCPVNCQMSAWSTWDECTQTCDGPGTQTRTRYEVVEPDFGGAACPNDEETRECGATPCPTDCELSDFPEWADLPQQCPDPSTPHVACGEVTLVRQRTILNRETHGGKKCSEFTDTQETKVCPFVGCPVNCTLTPFGGWSQCTKECRNSDDEDAGIRVRRRHKLADEKNGGTCEDLVQEEQCGNDRCPINCKLPEWEADDWGECSATCGIGKKKRTRDCDESCDCDPDLNTPGSEECTCYPCNLYEGDECPDKVEEVECNLDPCPIDCQVSEWSDSESCTKTCGGGYEIRHRSIIVHPHHNGTECGPLFETTECATEDCPADCKYTEWSYYGSCAPETSENFDTDQCGVGRVQYRTREVDQEAVGTGAACIHNVEDPMRKEKKDCADSPCPQDCRQVFSQWGDCSVDCGIGTQVRNRTELVPARYGGQECVYGAGTAEPLVQTCDEGPCSVDCIVSDWSPYTSCSKSCQEYGSSDYGVYTKTRRVIQKAEHLGTTCPVTTHEDYCNTDVFCPEDCSYTEWTSENGENQWSSCHEVTYDGLTVVCRGETTEDNTRKMWRDVISPAARGGTECVTDISAPAGANNLGRQEKSESCTADHFTYADGECPRDCVFSNNEGSFEVQNEDYSECSVTCGGAGTQTFMLYPQQTASPRGKCRAIDVPNLIGLGLTTGDSLTQTEYIDSAGSLHADPSGLTNIASIKLTRPCDLNVVCPTPAPTPSPPVDCLQTEWSDWQLCDQSCNQIITRFASGETHPHGTKTRTRSVLESPMNSGQECGDSTDTADCNEYNYCMESLVGETPHPSRAPTPAVTAPEFAVHTGETVLVNPTGAPLTHTPSASPTPAVSAAAYNTTCQNGFNTVQDGWIGAGFGSNYCNLCTCDYGSLRCSKKDCNEMSKKVLCSHTKCNFTYSATHQGFLIQVQSHHLERHGKHHNCAMKPGEHWSPDSPGVCECYCDGDDNELWHPRNPAATTDADYDQEQAHSKYGDDVDVWYDNPSNPGYQPPEQWTADQAMQAHQWAEGQVQQQAAH